MHRAGSWHWLFSPADRGARRVTSSLTVGIHANCAPLPGFAWLLLQGELPARSEAVVTVEFAAVEKRLCEAKLALEVLDVQELQVQGGERSPAGVGASGERGERAVPRCLHAEYMVGGQQVDGSNGGGPCSWPRVLPQECSLWVGRWGEAPAACHISTCTSPPPAVPLTRPPSVRTSPLPPVPLHAHAQGVAHSIPLPIKGEAYKIEMDINFPQASFPGVDFGVMRVVDDAAKPITIKNTGEHRRGRVAWRGTAFAVRLLE